MVLIWCDYYYIGMIKQFLRDVDWGDTEYLLIDTPPGTSDEHLSIVQYLLPAGLDGAIVITTPQEVALLDVRKEINFCHKVNLPILGVVENMSTFVCPKCHVRARCIAQSHYAFIHKCWTLKSVPIFVDMTRKVRRSSLLSQGELRRWARIWGFPFLDEYLWIPWLGRCVMKARASSYKTLIPWHLKLHFLSLRVSQRYLCLLMQSMSFPLFIDFSSLFSLPWPESENEYLQLNMKILSAL